jgi:signal transduction histidine kinase
VAGPDIRTHEVRHHAEVLGRVTLQERAGQPLTPLESRLFADLARRSGLVLRNVRLTTALQNRVRETAAHAAELHASRRRVVCAHDDARRRVERDIHDGAQQHLVALAVTVRLARNLAERDGAAAEKMLPDLRDAMEQTVATLTELSSGLYPRVLAEHGLPEALSQASRMSAVPVRVRAERVGRYSPELEAAVYFCSLEAVQNAAKHAAADQVDLVLEAGDGYLEFCVADNGRGFDTTGAAASANSAELALGSGLANMRDRVSAVGGSLAVHALPGAGTRVQGRVPLQSDGVAG